MTAKTTNIDYIYETLRDLGETSAKDVMAATQLSSSTVTDNLRKLVDQGRVERIGEGRQVTWRVLEQHEIPAGSDEPPVDTAAVAAEALDEIATGRDIAAELGERYNPDTDRFEPMEGDPLREEQAEVTMPVVAPAHHRTEYQDAEVVVAQVLNGDEPIVVEPPAESVADVLDDDEPRTECCGEPVSLIESGSVGHPGWPGCPNEAQMAQDEPGEPEVDEGSETPSEPASDDPGDVLAYMQAVRPVSSPPADEPTPTRAPRQRTSSEGGTSTHYRRGALSDQILEFFRDHPDESYGPAAVAKALSAQQGSVGYACDKLQREGSLKLTQDKPKRYQAA